MQDDRASLIRELSQEIAYHTAEQLIRLIREEFRSLTPHSGAVQLRDDRLIFINYRRSDSEDVCGRIYDRVAQTFGRDSVFRDVANILPGANFRVVLEREVSACDLMIVVMGREWLNQENMQRLHDENDFVRFEIETALKRDIPIIPVWVSRRNTMPEVDKLPTSVRDLVNRQAIAIRADPDFHGDVDRLIVRISDIFDLLDEMVNPPGR
ncbi:MAG: toll/interleukin-1 receptor domain-containing protein [Anaerolineae bacterium]|nr:toll/interleukin-1 receptor domain-containing protein [Anaerolineae bacterium]